MTIKQALFIIAQCVGFIAKRCLHLLYGAICKHPFIATTSFTLVIAVYAAISVASARAERDNALQQQITLQEQVEKLSLIIDAQKINK